MQLIECPWCGPRDEVEFHNGGQAHVAYPENPAATSDTDWTRYLFFRENTRGLFAERAVHSSGCRKWFNAVRDTRTHDILVTYRPSDPRPDLAELESARAAAPNLGVGLNASTAENVSPERTGGSAQSGPLARDGAHPLTGPDLEWEGRTS